VGPFLLLVRLFCYLVSGYPLHPACRRLRKRRRRNWGGIRTEEREEKIKEKGKKEKEKRKKIIRI
jgi:hypothetical protein